MSSAALGLSALDFDAYLPDRASSNAFSRPRLEFKQRALAWARGVTARLAELGIGVDVHGSDEHPSLWNHHRVDCQWVFFWRDASARADLDALLDMRRGIAQTVRDPSPTYRHAFLALRVDSARAEICVQVHPDAWLDFETLAARLAEPGRAASIAGVIAKLPDQFVFGLGNDHGEPCGAASSEALIEILRLARERSDSLWVGWSVMREVAIEHSTLLDEQLQDAIIALVPAYRELSWSEDDDPAQLVAKLRQQRDDTQRQAAERAAQDERRNAETEAARIEVTEKSRERTREKVEYAARPAVSLANLFKPDSAAAAPRAPEPPRALQPPRAQPADPKPPRDSRAKSAERDRGTAQQRFEAPRAEPPKDFRDVELVDDPNGAIDKGTKVRVKAGPFAGKVGVIGELDGRGGARVLLGLLSARLAVGDLTVVTEARDRPPLQSSHRRPPIRSGK